MEKKYREGERKILYLKITRRIHLACSTDDFYKMERTSLLEGKRREAPFGKLSSTLEMTKGGGSRLLLRKKMGWVL